MATFDAVTYSSLMALKEPIGSPILVPNNFTSDKYVDTGKSFDAAAFPKLAEIYGVSTDPTVVFSVDLPSSMQQLKFVGSNPSNTVNVASDYQETDAPPSVQPPVFLDNGTTGIAIEAGLKNDTAGIPNVSQSIYGDMYSTVFSDHVNLLRTTDGGSSWEHFTINFGENVKIITKVHLAQNTFFVFASVHATSTTFKIYTAYSTDGINWIVNNFATAYTYAQIDIASVGPDGFIYLRAFGLSIMYLYYSSDFGVSYIFGGSVASPSPSTSFLMFSGKYTSRVWSTATDTTSTILTCTRRTAAGTYTLANLRINYPNVYFGGMAETRDALLVYMIGSEDGFVSRDQGYSWKKVKLPYLFSSSWTMLSSVGDLFVFITESNSMLISKDGESWFQAAVPQLSPDLGIIPWKLPKYAAHGSSFFGGGRATHLTGKLLKISDTVNVVPYMESPTLGSKWVVRAK